MSWSVEVGTVRARAAGRSLVLAVLLGVGAEVLHPTAVSAQMPSCPAEGTTSAGIALLAPLPGDTVSGGSSVTGSARSRFPISRVELVIGDRVVDSQAFPDAPEVDFDLRWDAGRFPAGVNYLQVRACGASAYGKHDIGVRVKARRPLWVGFVIGTAGLAGLAYASAFRRGSPGVARLSLARRAG